MVVGSLVHLFIGVIWLFDQHQIKQAKRLSKKSFWGDLNIGGYS